MVVSPAPAPAGAHVAGAVKDAAASGIVTLASLKLAHPARIVPLSFLLALIVGTALLALPIAREGEGAAPLLVALFTATSAICVTGLVVVDTATYWSPFGQGVILALFQVGGFGIMTGATLLGLLVTRQVSLSHRLSAQAETKSMALGDVVGVVRIVLVVTVIAEVLVAAVLTWRLRETYGEAWGQALWNGVFQSVSAFNNAGFSTYSDSLIGFARDPVILGPIMLAVIVSGLGFPVIYELREEWRQPRRWSVHAKLTVFGTVALLILGFLAVLLGEWSNGATLGEMPVGAKMLNAMFHSVMTRTAGFNSVDTGALRTQTLFASDMLMLIGGGSAGTAGGIKVTTFFLLAFVVWAEIRGQPDATAFRRRICPDVQRQALAIVLLATSLISIATLILLSITDFPLDRILFEVISAFATVGLSTGITADLPPAGQLVLVVLMYVGRVGTVTVAAALALRRRDVPFRYPEERPIVG